jgi:fumarylacetoacetase
LDFELEIGVFVGGAPNAVGQPLRMAEAEERLFGMVLLNDWSARDLQKWEYVPLGPFTAKNFATTVSPWVVTMDALAPFGVPNQEQVPRPLSYLQDPHATCYDLHLDVGIRGANMAKPFTVSHSNAKYLYWTFKQQLVHHAVSGCSMVAGDLLGSGTISGPLASEYGSMLELSWRGTREVVLGEAASGAPAPPTRKFLADGDSVVMLGYAQAPNYRVGFGECEGTIIPPVKLE